MADKRLIDAIKHRLECHIAKAIHWGVDNIPMGKDSSSAFEFLRGYERGATETANIVLSMIPVDAVEVVHGRWLFDSYTERYFCSSCNEQALYTSRDVPEYDYDWEENLRYSHTETYTEEHLTNYCPNCGAKMDGDGNG